MKEVSTVLGPVPVNQLGRVLMHEHVFICTPGAQLDARVSYDKERDTENVATRLAALLEYGIRTVVDCTTVEFGRSVEFMVEASRRSGVNIVGTTGLYNEHLGLVPYFKTREIDEIADWMVWELTEGMNGTGIRAGAIKVATGLGKVGRHEEKALRAAARAHKRTGAPILTHTEGGTMGKEQVDIFEDEGADLSRVIIGHCCGNSDIRYHLDILKRGVNIGLDRIGGERHMPDEIRRGIAVSIIAAGRGSQMMLSQDMNGLSLGASTKFIEASRGRPQRNFTEIMTSFVPKLREAGVSEGSIDTCMAELPRRFFGD